jgi:hypothetical protein
MTTTTRLDTKGYKLEWIPCKQLSVVWVQAQRKLREERAKEIAANFDPDLFMPVRVTLPNGDGQYHICDGQHGKRAVELLFGADEKVPCLVAPEGDPVRAAELFLKLNTGRRPPDAIDHFKVAVTARMATEVAIDKIVRKNGFHVDRGQEKDKISAVSALINIYTTCSAKVLDQTLGEVRLTWPGDRNATQGPLLRGFGAFLNEFGTHLNKERFREVTAKKWTPGSLIRDAKGTRELHGGGTTEAFVSLLLSNYNRGARGGTALKRKQAA